VTLAITGGAFRSGWTWHAHPDVWVLMAGILLAYWVAIRRIGPRRVAPGEPVVTRRQVAVFCLGVGALWVHGDWPIHDISEQYLYSVHMVQHIGFTLIAPPLLLLGMPSWLWRWLFVDRPAVHAVVRRVARPLAAGIVFNTMTVLTHWPVVVDYSLEHHAVHLAVHLVMVACALIMWMPVVNRLPELPRPSYPVRTLYLFLQSVIPTIPASFLTFGDTVLYRFYAHVPRVFGLSAIDDQQLAGALMKVYAGTILWVVIAAMFFRWYAREQRPPEPMPEVLTWEHVERALQQSDPAAQR